MPDELNQEAEVVQTENEVEGTIEEAQNPPTPTLAELEELRAEVEKSKEIERTLKVQLAASDRKVTSLTSEVTTFQGLAKDIAEMKRQQVAMAKALLAQGENETRVLTPLEVYEAELKAQQPQPQSEQAVQGTVSTDAQVLKDKAVIESLFLEYGIDGDNPPPELTDVVEEASQQWNLGLTKMAVSSLKRGFEGHKASQAAKTAAESQTRVADRTRKAAAMVGATGVSQGLSGQYLSDDEFLKKWGDPDGKGLPATPENIARATKLLR